MNTVDKLNNTLGYLTAMSFDKPELSNDLVAPLKTLSEAISEVKKLSIHIVSQQREMLSQYNDFVNMQYQGVGLDDSDIKDFNHWLNT